MTPLNDNKVVEVMPYLNRYALFLTRNKPDADDLLQWTILRVIEEIRSKDLYVENPKPFLAKAMRYEWIRRFVKRRKVDQGKCEYEDYMCSVRPEQTAIPLCMEVQRQIERHKPHNQNMLWHFLKGEDWPKLRKATKDFKTEISIFLEKSA